MRKLVLVCAALTTLGACTTTDEIIIDTKGVNMTSYQDDLNECRGYAEGVQTEQKATRSAASGALIGGAVGAIFGGADGAARGAGAGAVTGGAKGVSEGERDEVQVVKRCLSGRGYRVLN